MSKKRSSVFEENVNKDDTAEARDGELTKKGRQFFFRKNRGAVAAQLPLRVTSTLVTPRTAVETLKTLYVSVENRLRAAMWTE